MGREKIFRTNERDGLSYEKPRLVQPQLQKGAVYPEKIVSETKRDTEGDRGRGLKGDRHKLKGRETEQPKGRRLQEKDNCLICLCQLSGPHCVMSVMNILERQSIFGMPLQFSCLQVSLILFPSLSALCTSVILILSFYLCVSLVDLLFRRAAVFRSLWIACWRTSRRNSLPIRYKHLKFSLRLSL